MSVLVVFLVNPAIFIPLSAVDVSRHFGFIFNWGTWRKRVTIIHLTNRVFGLKTSWEMLMSQNLKI